MRWLIALALAVALGGGAFWYLTRPALLDPSVMPAGAGDAQRGQWVFAAAGCGSCHYTLGEPVSDPPLLGGGMRLTSPFGTFVAPNISPDPVHGIGGWSALDMANALIGGVSPQGLHYYPVLPYASYARMQPGDVNDLFAYLQTLPPVARPNQPHELPLPFRWRRPLGGWKLLFVDDDPVVAAAPEHGRYLVEALGHCAECHTPRNLLGGLRRGQWLAGAANPAGEGRIPDITPGPGGIGSWSEAEIAFYLATGFTPEFDSVGGEMAAVIANLARLGDDDRAAIAAYLKAVAPAP